jgi:hypothetical protein
MLGLNRKFGHDRLSFKTQVDIKAPPGLPYFYSAEENFYIKETQSTVYCAWDLGLLLGGMNMY